MEVGGHLSIGAGVWARNVLYEPRTVGEEGSGGYRWEESG